MTSSGTNVWVRTTQRKQKMMRRMFNILLISFVIVICVTLVFSKLERKDLLIIFLLLVGVLGAKPYFEVAALKNKNAFQKNTLTNQSWQRVLIKPRSEVGNYSILNSTPHFLQSANYVMNFICLGLFALHKFFGKDLVTYNLLIICCIIQLLGNPLAGYNPLALFLIRSKETTKNTSQNEIRNYLKSNSSRIIPRSNQITPQSGQNTPPQSSSSGSPNNTPPPLLEKRVPFEI